MRVGGGAEDGKHYIKAKRTNVSCKLKAGGYAMDGCLEK